MHASLVAFNKLSSFSLSVRFHCACVPTRVIPEIFCDPIKPSIFCNYWFDEAVRKTIFIVIHDWKYQVRKDLTAMSYCMVH